jgi:phosphoribosylanthranilate isomerase
MNLHALDVNSGVEISPGRKEKSKVLSIIKKLRV